MKGDEIYTDEAVSELGIFGQVFWNKNGELIESNEIGSLMKTKPVANDEGGVFAGFAYMDCPYRFEGTDEEFYNGNRFK